MKAHMVLFKIPDHYEHKEFEGTTALTIMEQVHRYLVVGWKLREITFLE